MQPRRASPPSYSTAAGTGGAVILGKYQLGRLLGRGSFAKVYYARSLSDNSAVAVKVIDKAKTVDAAMEPRIVREVAAMRRLSNHPNILQIHEVMATKTKIYLVMELAKGGDVSFKLSRCGGRFSENTARRYFLQLISALHFCHHHGVAHRDIKPQNLLLDESGVLKLSDFGLSALSEQVPNCPLHTACGTPAFTAPEVFRHGAGGYDGAKSDAWSCGVILFLFLAGHLPFDNPNLATVYRKISAGEFVCPPWISKRAKSIIHRLLDTNPKTRMSIEALMGHAWFKNSLPSTHSIISPNEETKSATAAMNAFDVIAMSSGLDLSGLFGQTPNSDRERRFTAKASAEEAEERVVQVGRKLEYRVVERGGERRTIGLAKGRRILSAEILTLAPEVVMVVVKVVDGRAVDLELENLHWDEWRVGFDSLESTVLLSCHIQ